MTTLISIRLKRKKVRLIWFRNRFVINDIGFKTIFAATATAGGGQVEVKLEENNRTMVNVCINLAELGYF